MVGQTGGAEYFATGLAALSMRLADVRVAVAAPRYSLAAARISCHIFNAGKFDDFTLHAGRHLMRPPF